MQQAAKENEVDDETTEISIAVEPMIDTEAITTTTIVVEEEEDIMIID